MIHIHEYRIDTAGIYHCAFCNSILVILVTPNKTDDSEATNEN